MPVAVGNLYNTLQFGEDSMRTAQVNESSWSSLLTQGVNIEIGDLVTNVTGRAKSVRSTVGTIQGKRAN